MKSEIDAALGRLDDYLRGQLRDDVAQEYEAALFDRALVGAAPELEFWADLGATLRVMNVRGALDMWLTAAEAASLRTSDPRVVYHELDVANPVLPLLPPEAELLLTRIPLDLTDVHRLEAEVRSLDGRLLKRMPDIAFDPADQAVYACCEIELARSAASSPSITRLWATGDAGRRVLAEIPPVASPAIEAGRD